MPFVGGGKEVSMQLQDLPSEVFFRIFSFVPPKTLATKVSRVCVSWHSVSRDEYLWKYICLIRWGYLKRTQTRKGTPRITWFPYFKSLFDKRNLSFLILGAEGGSHYNERLLDVQQKIKSVGLVNVDVINVRTQLPTLDLLCNYNSVMFFSYHGFDQVTVGNVLADYADMGGGVVVCAYTNCGKGNKLEGRWGKGAYDPVLAGTTSRDVMLKLGKVHFPDHPILRGITSFSGGYQSSHGNGKLHPDARTIAEWTNGRPLVVEKEGEKGGGGLVALNMYPPSADGATGGWDAATQGAQLLANALLYVATRVD